MQLWRHATERLADKSGRYRQQSIDGRRFESKLHTRRKFCFRNFGFIPGKEYCKFCKSLWDSTMEIVNVEAIEGLTQMSLPRLFMPLHEGHITRKATIDNHSIFHSRSHFHIQLRNTTPPLRTTAVSNCSILPCIIAWLPTSATNENSWSIGVLLEPAPHRPQQPAGVTDTCFDNQWGWATF